MWPTFGQPIQSPRGANDCHDIGGSGPNDFWGDWPGGDGVANGQQAPFQGVTHLRPGKEGKVIARVGPDKSELPRKDCGTTPDLGIKCKVTYDWKGTITMTRVR